MGKLFSRDLDTKFGLNFKKNSRRQTLNLLADQSKVSGLPAGCLKVFWRRKHFELVKISSSDNAMAVRFLKTSKHVLYFYR